MAQPHTSAPDGIPAFYAQVEAILAALPDELSEEAAIQTANLLQTLFADYLELRLGKGGRHEA